MEILPFLDPSLYPYSSLSLPFYFSVFPSLLLNNESNKFAYTCLKVHIRKSFSQIVRYIHAQLNYVIQSM